jgi:hypothetical protein
VVIAILVLFIAESLLSGQARPGVTQERAATGTRLSISAPQAQQGTRSQNRDRSLSKDFERRQWFYKQRAYPLDRIPEGTISRALEQMERQAKLTPQISQNTYWANIGPAPVTGGQIVGAGSNVRVTGRIRDIDVDPTDPNHWLIGADGGGVWDTRDAGASWSPRTDSEIAQSTGAVAFAPSNPNIIYAGVGYDSGLGVGILRSSDGGVSWQLLGTSTFSNVSFFSFREIKVDPTNPNTLLVASWAFFGPTASTGIFKSTDGGVTWSQKLPGTATEFEVDPGNFNNMYAGIKTDSTGGNSSLNGVYRSTNAGETWLAISGPWGAITNGGSLIEFAIAPSNHDTLYVSFSRVSDGAHHWRTNNAWAAVPTWSELPIFFAGNFNNYQDSIVDPTNPDILYVGGFAALEKFTLGTGWSDVTAGTHVDQIAMAWLGSRLIVGNDGGMWSTTDGGLNWVNHNTNLSVTQFYIGSLHSTNPNFVLGASQDNGTERTIGPSAWQFLFGGDGNANAISSSSPDTNWAISACCGHEIDRTTNGGASFTRFVDAGIDYTGAPFVLEFEKCPLNDDVFIAGTDNLWRTNNFFSSGSPTWFANGPEMRDGQGNSDSITALAFGASSQLCVGRYAFGTGTGQLRLTTNGGTSWSNIDLTNAVPNRHITDLLFDPFATDTLYVTLSGTNQGTPGQPGHVFRTLNASSASPTWTNVSTPVNVAHNAIVQGPLEDSPNPEEIALYVGTDLGVWKSTNNGGSWATLGTGLPKVPVTDLQLRVYNLKSRLVAFTYGRGAFVLSGDDTIGVYEAANQTFYLRNSNSLGLADGTIRYGPPLAHPIMGDWDGNGTTTLGVYEPASQTFYLRNNNSPGFADIVIRYGPPGAVPIVGDWDGDGVTTIGVYQSSSETFYLRNSNTQGFADIVIRYGPSGATPIVGDWDGNRTTTIGVYFPDNQTFYLRNSNTAGFADLTLRYGPAGATALAGDWDGNGTSTIGVYFPSDRTFYLRNSNTVGFADLAIQYGPSGATPVIGDWDGP